MPRTTMWSERLLSRVRITARIILWIEVYAGTTLPFIVASYLLPSENIDGTSNGFKESLGDVPADLWIATAIAIVVTPFVVVSAMSQRRRVVDSIARGIAVLANVGLMIFAVLLILWPSTNIENRLTSAVLLTMGAIVVVALTFRKSIAHQIKGECALRAHDACC